MPHKTKQQQSRLSMSFPKTMIGLNDYLGEPPSRNWSQKRFFLEIRACKDVLAMTEENVKDVSRQKRKALLKLSMINKCLEGMLWKK